MASIPSQPEGKALIEYLTKALGLPPHLRWVELRVAVDEAIMVRCEWFPDVVEPDSAPTTDGG